jgi:hypothetical protein
MKENEHLKETPGTAQARSDSASPPALRDYVRVCDGALDGAVSEEIVQHFEADREHHFRRRMPMIRSFTELNIEQAPEWASVLSSLEQNAMDYFARYKEACSGKLPGRQPPALPGTP